MWFKEPDADEDCEEEAGDDDDEDQASQESVHGHGEPGRGLGTVICE